MSDTFTTRLLDARAPFLGPAIDPNGDYATYTVALGQMFEPVFSLVMDQGFPDDPDWVPGWSVLLDVDNCPAQYLPFLAQFVGAVIPTGTSEADARAIIRAEAGMQRGTPAAMIAAAKRNLTGTQYVLFLERTAADGSADPYHIVIGIRSGESGLSAGEYTALDSSPLIAAVEAIKPGGIQITYNVTDSWTIGELEAAEALVSNVESAFVTVGGAESDLPGF